MKEITREDTTRKKGFIGLRTILLLIVATKEKRRTNCF